MQVKEKRSLLQGMVTSDKMDKTIVVKVIKLKKHPAFGKIIRVASKYKAHDEDNQAHKGDVVQITGTRPLSKGKRHKLLKIVKKRN